METIRVDEWRPDYARECEVCGQTPCVTGWQLKPKLKEVYTGDMCGVCTWGEADCRDPENW